MIIQKFKRSIKNAFWLKENGRLLIKVINFIRMWIVWNVKNSAVCEICMVKNI